MSVVVHTKVLHLAPPTRAALETFDWDHMLSATASTVTFRGKPADVAAGLSNIARDAPSDTVARNLRRIVRRLERYAGAKDRHVQVTALSTGPDVVPPPARTPFWED